MDIKTRIHNHIRAGFGILALNTSEEIRTTTVLEEISRDNKHGRNLFKFSITKGLYSFSDGKFNEDLRDPVDFINWIGSYGKANKEPAIFMFLDPELDDPVLLRTLKDKIQIFQSGYTLVMVSKHLDIPSSISHLITPIDFPLPSHEDLSKVAGDIAESVGMNLENGELHTAALAASGLTTDEASNIMSLSIIEHKADKGEIRIDPKRVADRKAESLSSREFLQVYDKIEGLESVGGLENLKEWLQIRKKIFSQKARKFGIPHPKGLLMIGVPGCGKSLIAKVVPSILEVPLIRLDIGAIMGSLVGESEKNVREAIRIAEAMAPCVLWLDELDKQLGTSNSGGDHEVTRRVMASLLTWMQEKTAPVFVVATANNIQAIAVKFPEMLRKGRWDEIFFVDLPDADERKEIFRIHIQKAREDHSGRDANDFDLEKLVRSSDNMTGAEIEAAFLSALNIAFNEEADDVTTDHVMKSLKQTTPDYEVGKQNIESLRQWAKGRARPASKVDAGEERLRTLDL